MTQPPILPFWDFFSSFDINIVIRGFRITQTYTIIFSGIFEHGNLATFQWAIVSGIFAEDAA